MYFTYVCNNDCVLPTIQEFTLEGVCACPDACKSSSGGGNHESSKDPGIVGIILLCL